MTNDAEWQEPGPIRPGWGSRLKSRLIAFPIPLRVALLVLVAGLALLTLALSAKTFLSVRDRLRDQRARDAHARMLDRVRDQVDTLESYTLDGVVSLKLKYSTDGTVQYQFVFTPQAGLYIAGSSSVWSVTLQLLEKDGFLLHSETLTEFTRVVNPADTERRCIGLRSLGTFKMPLDSFVRISRLDAPHTLRFERSPLTQLPGSRRVFDFSEFLDRSPLPTPGMFDKFLREDSTKKKPSAPSLFDDIVRVPDSMFKDSSK